MKKLALVASLATALASVGIAQAASNGTITFNGELTATTCNVVVEGQTADATVTLPLIGINQLNANQTAGRTGFNMALNNCAGTLATASAFFESGGSVDPLTGRLKNMLTGATAASNVSLQLRDGSSSTQAVIQAGNQNQRLNTVYVAYTGSPTGSANLPYFVEYYADGPDSATAGKVQSSVIYSIQYK